MSQKVTTPQLPPADASPAVIRNYIESLLVELHSLTRKEAEDISAKWKLGRGAELISYNIDIYRAIFGIEAGTILFGHVRTHPGTSTGQKAIQSQGSGGTIKRRTDVKEDLFGLEPGRKLSLSSYVMARMTC